MSEFKKITIVQDSSQVCDDFYLDKVYKETDIITKSNDKYAANYTRKMLDLFGHKSFDVLFDDDDNLIGWCGLYNGNRYPDGVYRIMNRLYINPNYRQKVFNLPITRQLYEDQIARNEKDIKFLFLSRNEEKGIYHLKRWIQTCNEPGWVLSDGFVKVANCESKLCYQYIAYKKFAKDFSWNYKEISLEEWHQLKDE